MLNWQAPKILKKRHKMGKKKYPSLYIGVGQEIPPSDQNNFGRASFLTNYSGPLVVFPCKDTLIPAEWPGHQAVLNKANKELKTNRKQQTNSDNDNNFATININKVVKFCSYFLSVWFFALQQLPLQARI